MAPINVGDAPVLTVVFTDLAGTPTDPTTVTFDVYSVIGDETLTMPAATNMPAAGTWSAQCPPLAWPGLHEVRVVGSGALLAVIQGTFTVEAKNTP